MDNNPSRRKKSRKLITVPVEKGFHFFTDIGDYTGETATNLSTFGEELKVIDAKSLRFHTRRHDFQKWIKGTLGDPELAVTIDSIDENLSDEELRKRLVQVTTDRLAIYF